MGGGGGGVGWGGGGGGVGGDRERSSSWDSNSGRQKCNRATSQSAYISVWVNRDKETELKRTKTQICDICLVYTMANIKQR